MHEAASVVQIADARATARVDTHRVRSVEAHVAVADGVDRHVLGDHSADVDLGVAAGVDPDFVCEAVLSEDLTIAASVDLELADVEPFRVEEALTCNRYVQAASLDADQVDGSGADVESSGSWPLITFSSRATSATV